MIHAVTGVVMWVADDQVEEFIKRGHALAPLPKPEKATSEEMEAVKAIAKKRVRKK